MLLWIKTTALLCFGKSTSVCVCVCVCVCRFKQSEKMVLLRSWIVVICKCGLPLLACDVLFLHLAVSLSKTDIMLVLSGLVLTLCLLCHFCLHMNFFYFTVQLLRLYAFDAVQCVMISNLLALCSAQLYRLWTYVFVLVILYMFSSYLNSHLKGCLLFCCLACSVCMLAAKLASGYCE